MSLERRRAASGRPVSVRTAALAGLALVAALAGASQAAGVVPRSGATVVLRDIAFRKAVVRVQPGQRVTWTWNDRGVTHNIHSVGRPRFPGATARRSGSYAVRFARAGTYRYTCTLHPGMNGTVVVSKG